ncbi:hypothetical protein K5X82_08725 [Halosquirtibacter xylanolyticus]|uniref:hypothetical protein n=1 Tax=Halosquirtibacter xylanolyticus TaxID=3374599 RepID=UPI003749300B|nr:hypothetical protein K5X82_08725 [Prolixibacteraceae bacterium]
MGRKEYFETLEHFNMLKKEAVDFDENTLVDGMTKREYIQSIDSQIEQVKQMVSLR